MNTQKPNTPEIHPNFNHRVTHTPDKPLSSYELIYGIEQITSRASGVVSLLQSLCSIDDGEPLRAINPEIIYFSLESIGQDLKDLESIGGALLKRGVK